MIGNSLKWKDPSCKNGLKWQMISDTTSNICFKPNPCHPMALNVNKTKEESFFMEIVLQKQTCA